MELQKTAEGTILEVDVKPNSKEFKIEINENKLVVFCRETPVKGRVNRELVKHFSRLFKRKIEIVSGYSSRQKRILIKDTEPGEVTQVLQRAHT